MSVIQRKIYWIRHGESMDDIENCWGGAADFALSPAGQQAAYGVAEQLRSLGIQQLYASPYKRAAETARIICTILQLPCETMEDLCERNSYGVLSGVEKQKSKEIFPLIYSTLQGRPGDYYADELLPGAEPLNEFHNRVKGVIATILEESDSLDTIGIVTHGNVTRALYHYILGYPGKINPAHCSFMELSYDGTLRLERMAEEEK